jgi:hypothetical protein
MRHEPLLEFAHCHAWFLAMPWRCSTRSLVRSLFHCFQAT